MTRGRIVKIACAAAAIVLLAAGSAAVWYRATYNVWPGQGASARVHWCGRDYEYSGGAPGTWRQISSQVRHQIRLVATYPPLAFSPRQLFAATTATAQRDAATPPLPCAMVVYLRTGPDAYQPYTLEGGP